MPTLLQFIVIEFDTITNNKANLLLEQDELSCVIRSCAKEKCSSISNFSPNCQFTPKSENCTSEAVAKIIKIHSPLL